MTRLDAHGYTVDLVDSGQSGAAFGNAVIGHRRHSLLSRDGLEVGRLGARAHSTPDGGRHPDHLEYATAPTETRMPAPIAAVGLIDHVTDREAHCGVALIMRQIADGETVRLLAFRAQHADQALADDGAHARGKEETLNSHVNQPGD